MECADREIETKFKIILASDNSQCDSEIVWWTTDVEVCKFLISDVEFEVECNPVAVEE